ILVEAMKAGLKIDGTNVRRVLHRTPIERPAWANAKHESLTGLWRLAEFFPKVPKWKGPGLHWPTFGLFRGRTIEEGALIHRSALRRLRRTQLQYSPKNLRPEFQLAVKALPKVPETLPYTLTP